jgi:hypothetical protein
VAAVQYVRARFRLCAGIAKNLAVVLGFSSIPFAFGQPSEPVELRTLPVWPGTTAASKTSPVQYVFRDRNEEIVVSYPDPADPPRIVTFRFRLQNRVAPQISVTIKRNSEGGFTYDYTLGNGLTAQTGIWAWSIVGPPSKDIAISHPGWHAMNSFESVVAPQALLPSAGTGVYLRWDDAMSPIAPGSKQAGFELVSHLRPGLTTAYASGWEDPIRSPTELPEDVVEQIIPLERAQVMDRVTFTIGPRFAPNVENQSILEAYQTDIHDLVEGGFLNGKSPFIEALSRALTRATASHQNQIEPLKEEPRNPAEKALIVALALALGVEGR